MAEKNRKGLSTGKRKIWVTLHLHLQRHRHPWAQSVLLTAAPRAWGMAVAEWKPGISGLLRNAGAGGLCRSQLLQKALCLEQEGDSAWEIKTAKASRAAGSQARGCISPHPPTPVSFRLLFLGRGSGPQHRVVTYLVLPVSSFARGVEVERETLQCLGPSDALAPFSAQSLELGDCVLGPGTTTKEFCLALSW